MHFPMGGHQNREWLRESQLAVTTLPYQENILLKKILFIYLWKDCLRMKNQRVLYDGTELNAHICDMQQVLNYSKFNKLGDKYLMLNYGSLCKYIGKLRVIYCICSQTRTLLRRSQTACRVWVLMVCERCKQLNLWGGSTGIQKCFPVVPRRLSKVWGGLMQLSPEGSLRLSSRGLGISGYLYLWMSSQWIRRAIVFLI